MTRQCMEVMSECDFASEEARAVEMALTRYTPKQLVRLAWSKDPAGEHDFAWLKPFFDHGYVTATVKVEMPGEPDEEFWRALDWWSQAQAEDGLSSYDLPAIWTMSRNQAAMKVAYGKSRVKSPVYVVKVFEGEAAVQFKMPERTKVDFEIGNAGVRTEAL